MTTMKHVAARIEDDPRGERASSVTRILRFTALAALVLACAIPTAMNVVDPDLWGHVRYGQDWLAEGRMPRTATHTFTAEGYPWVNHENAFELSVAWGLQHVSIYGLLVAKCLLGLAIIAAMARTARRHGVPALSAWTLLVLVAASLQAFFPLRPQLFSFALCAAMLVALDRAFVDWQAGGRVRWAPLALVPALMPLWVNSHGGFVAGLCILAAYLGGRSLEALRRRGRDAWRMIVGFSVVGLTSLAATALNPYGLELHRWIARSMWTPQPEITEWLPPTWENPVFLPFVTLAVVAVACLVGTQRRRDWTQIAIIALVGWQAAMHLRHIAFFALVCGFWLPVHWHSALSRLKPQGGWQLFSKLHTVRGAAAPLALLLAVVFGESRILAGRLSDFPVYRSAYPVDALQYMVDRRLSGKLVVAFNWAQYALTALAPETTVGFDGRFDTCYPDEVIDWHFDFLLGECDGLRFRSPNSGPFDREKILAHCQPDLVLIDRRYKGPTEVMHRVGAGQHPAWTLLYSDSIAELWGRTSRYDDPASPHYLPPEQRTLGLRLLQARFQWPALPDRSLWEELDRNETAAVEPVRWTATHASQP